jgi:hypothetical protein
VTTHHLTREQARRIAVRAQWLHRDRPPGLLDLVRHLTFLQVDLTASVAPSADLVAWSRLGSAYSPADLEAALGNQALVELRGRIRPAEDLALYRAEMAGWDNGGAADDWPAASRDWVAANHGCRLDILNLLRTDGPLPAREIPDTCEVPWRSTGWTNNRNVLRPRAAAAAVAGYHSPPHPTPTGGRIRGDSGSAGRLAGRPGPTGPAVQRPGRPAVCPRPPRLRPQADGGDLPVRLPAGDVQARQQAAFGVLRAADPLRLLYGDRLVGKLDATSDRPAGVLRVDAIHQDVPFTKAMNTAIHHEIESLAAFLNLRPRLPR